MTHLPPPMVLDGCNCSLSIMAVHVRIKCIGTINLDGPGNKERERTRINPLLT